MAPTAPLTPKPNQTNKTAKTNRPLEKIISIKDDNSNLFFPCKKNDGRPKEHRTAKKSPTPKKEISIENAKKTSRLARQ